MSPISNSMDVPEYEGQSLDTWSQLREYLGICRRRLWLIISVALLFLALAWIWSATRTPIYQATAGIVAQMRVPKVMRTELDGGGSSAVESVEAFTTQVKLITSYPVLKETVKRLKFGESPKQEEQKDPIAELLKSPKLAWVANLRLWFLQIQNQIEEYFRDLQTKEGTKLRTEAVADFPSEDEARLAKRFQEKVLIEVLPKTHFVLIRVKSQDPRWAAKAANTLATVYIEKMLEKDSQPIESAVQWFDSHLMELRKKVEDSEQALYNYRLTHNLVSASDQQSIATEKLAQLNSALVNAETVRTDAQTRYQQIQDFRERIQNADGQELGQAGLESLSEVLDSNVVQRLRDQEVHLSIEKAKLEEKYGPLHPQMVRIQTELKELKSRISEEVEKQYRSIKNIYHLAMAREQAARKKLEEQKAQKLALDKQTVEYSILEREANSNRHLYDSFLKQMSEANLASEMKSSTMYLAEPALPNMIPISPKTSRNLLVGLFLGLATGIGLVFFVEFWDPSLKGPEDVDRYLAGVPFLGWIPVIPKVSKNLGARLVHLKPLCAAADRYRHIRTSVWLASENRRPLSLLVTSPNESEGKTTLASNLAIAISQLEDNRVVLVDTDLRRPSLDSVFQIPEGKEKGKGLLQYLTNDREITEVLHQTEIPNLAVIPAGGIPPNPAELLHSSRMKALVDWCSQQGFHLVLDCPPALPVPDSLVLSSLVAGVILVVCAGKTNRASAQAVSQNLVGNGAHLLGIAMQKVQENRLQAHYYGTYKTYTSQKPLKEDS